jgi:haloacetate dehalogenase
MEFSLGFWVWSFLAAPEPVPERLISGDPEVLVEHVLDS